MIRGVTDTYKNNKALELLGYTGKTIRYNAMTLMILNIAVII